MTWNGKDLPPEFRELRSGRYIVEAVDDEAPVVSSDEDAGIETALESYCQGRVVDAKRAREIIDAALGCLQNRTKPCADARCPAYYSHITHIRIDAKRQALDAFDEHRS